MPPLLPVHLPRTRPQFQTVSDEYDAPAPVVNVVPPTCVMFVLSDGKGIALVKASESPEALKNDCPCIAIWIKACSAVGLGPPPPHEQLSCFAKLSLAIRLSRSSQGLGLGAS